MLATPGEGVYRKQTVVLTATAMTCFGGVLQIQQFLPGEQTSGLTGVMCARNQRGTERTHDPGNVGTDDLNPGNLFKSAQYGFVVEGTPLNNDVGPELRGIGELDDLVESVLDDGICQSRGDILNRGAFLLRLLDIGIHEDGAAGAEIHRVFSKERLPGKALSCIAQGIGKVFQERTAAGAAGFVEQDVIDGTMAEADALHILTTDVQHTVHLRIKERCGGAVGNGLNLAFIEVEGGFEKLLTVTGGAGAYDMSIFRKAGKEFAHGSHCRTYRVAPVV